MRSLIRQERIYQQVMYDSESHFEDVVRSEIPKLLTNSRLLKFSPYVIGDEGLRRRPDLAIVDDNYRMWAVVEVELDRHSLEGHVIPQVKAFASGNYGAVHADSLYKQDDTLDLDRLRNLTLYCQPHICVIVNSRSVLDDGWRILETDHDARLVFLESFRAEDDDPIFYVSGNIPNPPGGARIALAKPSMLNALQSSKSSAVPPSITTNAILYWKETPQLWEVIRTGDRAVFLPPGGFTIRDDRNYEIREVDRERYELREL